MKLSLYLRSGQVVEADVDEISHIKGIVEPGLAKLTWTSFEDMSGLTQLIHVALGEIVAITVTRDPGSGPSHNG